jgi:hypothetical protein
MLTKRLIISFFNENFKGCRDNWAKQLDTVDCQNLYENCRHLALGLHSLEEHLNLEYGSGRFGLGISLFKKLKKFKLVYLHIKVSKVTTI